MAPPELAPEFHSLPPILHMTHQTPMPGSSKGPQGLSVPPRVGGIFTTTTTSPGPSLRQRPSRCAIRAGHNLRGKEFRYLRHPKEWDGPYLNLKGFLPFGLPRMVSGESQEDFL